ncbi:AAA family ATPase [Paenibacillus sp. 276b]|uniref:AAA family ATPase n=1 Tax=Paenibacillus sp. 276b TaxID=1566277 RepID=UPI00089C560C|nr:AAA family ATPase [Paenibacillus sp. 276b]SEB27693.1 AAA+-type ATPase, SpoVK/Ycf46/Vps4 family [Paenibacillus sp. 276b]
MTKQTIENYINACYPAIWINTFEENRCINALQNIAHECTLEMKVWSCTEGYLDYTNSMDDSGTGMTTAQDALEYITDDNENHSNTIFVLKNFHHYMDNPYILQKLKDTILSCINPTNYIIFVSPKTVIPIEVEKDIAVTTFTPLDIEKMGEVLDRLTKPKDIVIDPEYRTLILKNSLGLTEQEAENVYSLAYTIHREYGANAVKTIQEEKANIIKKTGILEFIPPSNNISDIGGASEFKTWAKVRKESFSEEAKAFGVQSPKGVLLCGVSGGGKSASARALGNLWQLPILRFNIGKVFGSYVGESEANMQTALRTSESMSPCILWIDEIEKALAGLGSDSSGNGVTSRVFGELLTWMQEKEKDVFVLATGNNINELPPELMRKGRFDEIFWFGLPENSERIEILSIHIKKRGRNPENFDLSHVSEATEGFVGAELEQVIIDGISLAFADRKDLSTTHLIAAAEQTIPLSSQRKEEIDTMRTWANNNARSASTPVKKSVKRTNKSTTTSTRRLS